MDKLDIREATNRYDTAFVSSIRTYGNLGPFRPADRRHFKGIRLFDMLLRPEQVVCGSTVRAGDEDGMLYGNWGVIIGQGDIQQAFPYDATSYIVGQRAVSPYEWRNEKVSLSTQVEHAIAYRSGHNEVDIALGHASIAGIFIGKQAGGFDGIDLPSDEVLDAIAPLKIPTYQLSRGQFYSLTHGITSPQPTSPRELIKYAPAITPEATSYMKTLLLQQLVLPPRNAVSAGLMAGDIQRHDPLPHFEEIMEQHLQSKLVDRQYFGSMAIFAAGIQRLVPQAAFNRSTYDSLAKRVLPGGMLKITSDELDHYIVTGMAPDYLGKI